MADLTKQIIAEKENVEIALENLKEAMRRDNKSVVELAAIATFLHNIPAVWTQFLSEIKIYFGR